MMPSHHQKGSTSTSAFRERVLNMKGWDAEYMCVGAFLAKHKGDAVAAVTEAVAIECGKRYASGAELDGAAKAAALSRKEAGLTPKGRAERLLAAAESGADGPSEEEEDAQQITELAVAAMNAAADASDLDHSKPGYEWIAQLPQQMLSIITQKKAVFSDCPLGQATYGLFFSFLGF